MTKALRVSIGGTWHNVKKGRVSVGGVWRNIKAWRVSVGGVWRDCTPAPPAPPAPLTAVPIVITAQAGSAIPNTYPAQYVTGGSSPYTIRISVLCSGLAVGDNDTDNPYWYGTPANPNNSYSTYRVTDSAGTVVFGQVRLTAK